ncbi:Plastocyanin-like [Macleaya cordata]|uniref:Plastocyanin-like n=1 Tax=Macleaya cordata TaxID=56857 RepID=A0A200QKZ1_MACCD|nr:Plastocyanin-like [Macleaya cordata]
MAKTISRSSDKINEKKALMQGLVVFCVVLLMMERSVVDATEFKVGGAKGWNVPSDSHALTYNQWAEMNRFQIGDSLLFVYQPDNDLVMQVNKEDYANCNTATPIATYSDGKTSIVFKDSGPHYFISGIKENCIKNEKMVVVVMANRNSHSSNSNQTSPVSPAPAPSGSNQTNPVSPAPAPSGSIEIVPAPVGMESPSQAPSGSTVSSAPAGQQSPPSAPSSPSSSSSSSTSSPMKFASFIVSAGAIVGSSLFLDL